MNDSWDISDWPNSVLGKKISKLEENLNCPICCEMYDNPHSLNCGHSYCSLCIRRHFDKALNTTTSDQCPTCREKSDSSHLRPNRDLAKASQSYKEVRPDILHELKSNLDNNSRGSPSNDFTKLSRIKRSKEDSIKVTRKLAHMSFHGKSKKYVKDAVEKLCSTSRVKPNLEGDQDELERYYREVIHLNNAQIESMEPLSFDNVIKECNKKDTLKRKEARTIGNSKGQAEAMKKGEISATMTKRFQLMVQKVKNDKSKLLKANNAASSSSSSSSQSEPVEISSSKEPGEYGWGIWRVIMSDNAGRPFFYNTKTKTGQFSIPEELSLDDVDETKYEDKYNEINASDDEDENTSNYGENDDFDSSCLTQSRTRSQSQHSTSKKTKKGPESLSMSNGSSSHLTRQGKNGKGSNRGYETSGNVGSDENEVYDLTNDDVNCERKLKTDDNDDASLDDGDDFEDEGIETEVVRLNGRVESHQGKQDSDTDDNAWTCTNCTYSNSSNIFSCEMCAKASGRQRQGRSQKDISNNGSIMNAFSNTQTQSTQRNGHTSWGMSDHTQTTQTTNDISLGARNAKKRLSSSTSILDYGSSKKPNSNHSRRRS